MVLLHGFAASPFTWRGVVDRLAAAHSVRALERPWAPLATSVAHTMAQLEGTERPVLVGHSAGAELAVLVASRRPVAGLVLAGPVIATGPPAIARRVAALPGLRAVAPPVLRAGIRAGLGRALRRAWADPSAVTAEVVDGYRGPLLAPGAAEALWEMTARAEPLPVDWAALAGVPTLVVRGDRDRWATSVPLPHAVTVEYEGCGHLPQEEDPDRFATDVLRFVDGLPIA